MMRPHSAPGMGWPRRSYLRHPSTDVGNVLGDDPRSPLTQPNGPEPVGRHRLSKPRRILIIACILTGFFFSCLDAAIVATSMVSISKDLEEFANIHWVILSYLLSYMGFSVFLSRISDVYGRRDILLVSWLIFLCFSLACARAETMLQLIVSRAFQGIGGSGLYSLAQIALTEYGPVNKPSLIGAMIGSTLSVSLVLGPILGGVISELSTWRWVFDMNIPFSAVTMVVMAVAWPTHEDTGGPTRTRYSIESVKRIDFLGSATLLCSCCLLIVGLQQAGAARYLWSDAVIVVVLALSVMSAIVFIIWQFLLNKGAFRAIKPIFPVNLLKNRVFTATLAVTLLTGFVYLGLMVIIPERFQIVHNDNALTAGLKLLPLLGSCALASFAAGAASRRKNNTSIILVVCSALQLLGAGLMTMIDKPSSSNAALYGFQVIVGFGVGLCFSAATTAVSLQVSKEDLATAHGVISQARLLGGCLGISICTVIFNYHNNDSLRGRISTEALDEIHLNPSAITDLSSEDQHLIKQVYAKAFAEEVKVMLYVSGAMFLVSLLTLERNPPQMARLAGHQLQQQGPADDPEDKQSTGRASHSSTGTELSDLQPIAFPRFARPSVSRDGLPI